MKYILSCVLIIAALNFQLAYTCGLEGVNSRIYKGTVAKAHKYPWMAHIRIYSNRKTGTYFQCGGSLIDERHILSAAHCIVHEGKTDIVENIDVYLGRVKGFSERGTALKVKRVNVDAKYDPKNLGGDFAILTLADPVKFNSVISPICLPNTEKGLNQLTVIGWGATSAKGGSSDDLLEVNVQYLPANECNRIKGAYLLKENDIPLSKMDYYFEKGQIPKIQPSHICAINKKTMGDSCSGDSGGPLMAKNSKGRWVLMGIVSGSWAGCGESNDTAGLYTRTRIYQKALKVVAPNSAWVDL